MASDSPAIGADTLGLLDLVNIGLPPNAIPFFSSGLDFRPWLLAVAC